jgi:integrative and conjugative element protein (TIGR02256 family)
MLCTYVVWFPSQIHDEGVGRAKRYYPLETGGALMGYWHDDGTAVVTASIDPGPNAVRTRHNFEPDQEWQLKEIARRYYASGRRETYLGDWHTHPDASSGRLSFTDRRVLRRIINTPAARALKPLMIVFHGDENEWEATTWVAELKARPIIWPRLECSKADLRLFQVVR